MGLGILDVVFGFVVGRAGHPGCFGFFFHKHWWKIGVGVCLLFPVFFVGFGSWNGVVLSRVPTMGLVPLWFLSFMFLCCFPLDLSVFSLKLPLGGGPAGGVVLEKKNFLILGVFSPQPSLRIWFFVWGGGWVFWGCSPRWGCIFFFSRVFWGGGGSVPSLLNLHCFLLCQGWGHHGGVCFFLGKCRPTPQNSQVLPPGCLCF